MDAFSKNLGSLQQAILDAEYRELPGELCRCGTGQALYYCKDCFLSPLQCKSCIISTHSHIPFHHIHEWSGTHFQRISPSSLGLLLQLGHHSGPCPNHSDSPPRDMTVIHTNGIHKYQLVFCHCVDAPSEPLQLTRSRLFPATLERPETVFTFSVLDNFHMLSLTSKIPAYDYWNALVNLTDHVFPKTVKVRHISISTIIHSDQRARTDIVNFFGWDASGATSQCCVEWANFMALTIS